MSDLARQLEACFAAADRHVIRVPALVKGRLCSPPALEPEQLAPRSDTGAPENASAVSRIEGTWVIRRPLGGAAGEHWLLVTPSPDPRELIETDWQGLARSLYGLPFREIERFIGAVQEKVLSLRGRQWPQTVQAAASQRFLHGQPLDFWLDHLAELLDPEGLADMVDRQLGKPWASGQQFLDGWVGVDATIRRGYVARMAPAVFGNAAPVPRRLRAQVRAMPTRQLHITAGNAPVVPIVSFLYGLVTKGVLVVKSPAESNLLATMLALAMWATDPEHPVTRATSLVYWKGGDSRYEDVLFAPEAFDRLVVWGSPETVGSVRARAPKAKTIFLNPRYGLSLIGRAAFPDHMQEVAMRGSTDTLIANQLACWSSLVHYVEGDEATALAYCQALQQALARWDEHAPNVLSRATLGQVRLLRRTAFLEGTWFTNGTPPAISSAVVYLREPFDLSVHPTCRLVVVRRLDRLEQIFPFLNSSISTIGVYPTRALIEVRDGCAAAGVSNLFPLGECEGLFAGMPHDGMQILGELVNWTTSMIDE